MKNPAMSSLAVGVCITGIVVLLQALEILQGWEYRSIDFRYRSVPRDAQPMTDAIVLIDIDDGAIDQIGRWPWNRSIVADAIDELKRAKVGTVALDMLLSAPSDNPDVDHDALTASSAETSESDQPAQVDLDALSAPFAETAEVDQEPAHVDHDARLSDSLDRVSAVLAVTLHQVDASDVWTSDAGRFELGCLLDVLSDDLQIAVDPATQAAGLTGPRTKRFAERPLLFKRAAATRALQRGDFTTFEQFEKALIPNKGEFTRSYAEQRTLQMAWDQHRAWQYLRESLVDERPPERYLDQAPVPELAISAGAVGFVNIDPDQHDDGAVREVSIRMPAPGGDALQFGLAAAAAHRRLTPAGIEFVDHTVKIGKHTLPLHGGKLWLDWPTSNTEPRWHGLLRQTDAAPPTAGHISILQLVNMAQARRTVESNRGKRDEVAAFIAGYLNIDDDLPESQRLAVLEEVKFRRGVEFDPDPSVPSQVEVAVHLSNCRLWEAFDTAIIEGEKGLDKASRDIQRQVEGKLAFVGWIATGAVADFVPTSVGRRTPGVVIHAAVANMALTGRSASFMPPWLELVLTALLGVLCTAAACTAAAARVSAVVSTIIVAVVIAAYVLVADVWAFRSSTVLAPMVAPMLSGGASWIACTTLLAVVAQRARRRIEGQFKTRVSEQLVKQLIKHPERVSLTGEERDITVMFTDLAGFTSIAESLGGPATVATLNRYMSALADMLVERDAYLNKFLGDGFMAFWSAFEEDEDQAPKACQAALNCQSVMAGLNDDSKYAYADGRPLDLRLRIGIATGKVVVGDCGAPPKLNDYTVIGDEVNLAARLESANKQFGTDILIDGATQSALDPAKILTRPIGRVVVVGQKKAVDLFAVLRAETKKDEAQSLMDLSAQLVAAVKARRFEEARRLVKAIEVAHPREPKDRDPILDRYDEWLPDNNWDGIIRLADK